MNPMEIIWLILAIIIVGIAVMVFRALRNVWRDAKSYKASRGDEALEAMEHLRLKAKALNIAGVVLGLATLVAGVYCELPVEVIPLAGAGVYCFFLVWALVIKRKYNQSFKENIVKAELAKVLDNLHYEPGAMLEGDALINLNFFRNADRFSGNDLIIADYKGIHFSQCDMRVSEQYQVVEKGETRTRWRDIFRGRAMQFTLESLVEGKVRVVKRNFDAAKAATPADGWQKVETELDEFNTLFDVYAENPLDAMAILTPQMIEGIFFLCKALDFPVAFHFHENTMYAFMQLAHETFDVSHKKTLLEERAILERDIALVTGFFDIMYFKPRSDRDTKDLQAERDRGSVSKRVATVAAVAGPTVGEKLSRKAVRATAKTIHYLSYAIIAVFLLSAVYTLYELPDTIRAGTTADSEEFPTVLYLIVVGIFIIPPAYMRTIQSYAMAILLLMIHFFILSANLG